ncbi:unnamed protein product [Discosporangium mesarthrocarpum]
MGSRTVCFSRSNMEDLRKIQDVLQQDDVCSSAIVVIPSWRQHVIQYDNLSAALGVLKIPTAVAHLPDGLWAYGLQRLQVSALRRAAKSGLLQLTIIHALEPLFAHVDKTLRENSRCNPGRNLVVIASDDSAWLVRSFFNSRSAEWHREVPVSAAVLVGNYHKSIVGELALEVFPSPQDERERMKERAEDWFGSSRVKFFSLNGRQGGFLGQVGEGSDSFGEVAGLALDPSISCMSLMEDTENCIIQEHELGQGGGLSWLESTGLLGLWVPRVLQARRQQ